MHVVHLYRRNDCRPVGRNESVCNRAGSADARRLQRPCPVKIPPKRSYIAISGERHVSVAGNRTGQTLNVVVVVVNDRTARQFNVVRD